VEDDHVDRPGVEAQQCVKLTGTNSSFGLIALIISARRRIGEGEGRERTKRSVEISVRVDGSDGGTTWRLPFVVRPPMPTVRRRSRRRPVLGRPGGSCEGPKPDPIPNSAVKSLSAHGTKPQGLGESVAARPAKHRISDQPLKLEARSSLHRLPDRRSHETCSSHQMLQPGPLSLIVVDGSLTRGGAVR
jgi:hypothetical protein